MSTSGPDPAATGLSHGIDIEYKAFARHFGQSKVAVLYLVATCYYKTSGFTILFEEDSGKFKLMEQPPTGVFRNLVTYYVASWPQDGMSGERVPPTQLTMVDSHGEHRVPVRPWR